MISMQTVRRQLDTQLKQSQQNFYRSASNLQGASMSEWYQFYRHMQRYASSTWAANQEVNLNHNLARSIINDIR